MTTDPVKQYRTLPDEKRAAVLAVIVKTEGRYGDLKNQDERNHLHIVIRGIVGDHPFATAFVIWFEGRWASAQMTDEEWKKFQKEMPRAAGWSDYDRLSIAAEGAFRDFHDEFVWAEEELTNSKPYQPLTSGELDGLESNWKDAIERNDLTLINHLAKDVFLRFIADIRHYRGLILALAKKHDAILAGDIDAIIKTAHDLEAALAAKNDGS